MKHKVIAVIVMAFAILAGGALSPPGQANAAGFGPDSNGAYFFHSPSGRYSCGIFPAGNRWLSGYQAGCQGRTSTQSPAETQCLRKWGPGGMAMVLKRDGARPASGRFECQSQGLFVGGTTANGSGTGRVVKPVLPYGRSLTAGGVTCTMRTSGITCRNNRTGHGFFISLQSHRGF
ncbi:DUF6636 domain-containing protein [Gordonia effusa]|uniref:DUF6636 domain-containing protein n=1 Tax=Gordonia effusa TaxID=263908 RepID=UPI00058FE32E|nr:DUF6636 domain-containing protein [Gordonia effusa]